VSPVIRVSIVARLDCLHRGETQHSRSAVAATASRDATAAQGRGSCKRLNGMSATIEPDGREALHRELLDQVRQLCELTRQVLRAEEGERAARPGTPEPMPLLTPRELQILRLLAVGLTNRQIGTRSQLGAGTVRNHLGRIFRKLGVTSRTQAAVRALELGLVRPEDMPC
jgi:DNA-binding NarL/FixJ family response regulator